jgi:hypothetical protein
MYARCRLVTHEDPLIRFCFKGLQDEDIFRLPHGICKQAGRQCGASGERLAFFIAKTSAYVIIDHARGLHVSIDNRAADEFEAALF